MTTSMQANGLVLKLSTFRNEQKSSQLPAATTVYRGGSDSGKETSPVDDNDEVRRQNSALHRSGFERSMTFHSTNVGISSQDLWQLADAQFEYRKLKSQRTMRNRGTVTISHASKMQHRGRDAVESGNSIESALASEANTPSVEIPSEAISNHSDDLDSSDAGQYKSQIERFDKDSHRLVDGRQRLSANMTSSSNNRPCILALYNLRVWPENGRARRYQQESIHLNSNANASRKRTSGSDEILTVRRLDVDGSRFSLQEQSNRALHLRPEMASSSVDKIRMLRQTYPDDPIIRKILGDRQVSNTDARQQSTSFLSSKHQMSPATAAGLTPRSRATRRSTAILRSTLTSRESGSSDVSTSVAGVTTTATDDRPYRRPYPATAPEGPSPRQTISQREQRSQRRPSVSLMFERSVTKIEPAWKTDASPLNVDRSRRLVKPIVPPAAAAATEPADQVTTSAPVDPNSEKSIRNLDGGRTMLIGWRNMTPSGPTIAIGAVAKPAFRPEQRHVNQPTPAQQTPRPPCNSPTVELTLLPTTESNPSSRPVSVGLSTVHESSGTEETVAEVDLDSKQQAISWFPEQANVGYLKVSDVINMRTITVGTKPEMASVKQSPPRLVVFVPH